VTAQDVVVAVLAGIGVLFSLSGAVGIVRMPDLYTRIQCSSKTVTMGAVPLLVALAVAEGPFSEFAGRALVVAMLLVIFSPVASHALGRAAYKQGVPMWKGTVIDQPRQGSAPGSAGED
jgi:multicomponent Na+:H+ antiporter subunit G